MGAIKPSLALNKAYRQLKITTEEFAKFQQNLKGRIISAFFADFVIRASLVAPSIMNASL